DRSCVTGLAWGPDGRRLALAAMNKGVFLCDAATGGVLRTLPGAVGPVNSVAFSPDGPRLACGGPDSVGLVIDPESGPEPGQLRAHADKPGSVGVLAGLAFSPGGDRLATATFDLVEGRGAVKLWDALRGVELLTLPGHMTAAFSADGRRL